MINYKKILNTEQFEAANILQGPALIIAGAGTGKTATVTYRAARLIEKGVNPENILLITFTNKAADELVNPDLVVPDDVTKGEIVQNVSQDADAQYQKNWTEFKAACD